MARTRLPGVDHDARVSAILGPTNTGKTHTAIERLLGHKTGMIGLPLRLLAQEVYERVVARVGVDQVALVTGEQKRVPKTARYWICTVESMPVSRPVAFLAIDEIQLAGHPVRGRVFTDRVLNARGLFETLFLGSDIAERLLRRLVPEASIERRPRFSTLRYAGTRKLTALPRRSAVIAFSVADVYAHAERLRRRHGGTAVVLGALSPRARNAQVALYQSGEVDHIVATDAIGMGLNLDVDHVAFTALRKFDGRRSRDLTISEISQIAGRAGRYRRDGTFGTTTDVGPLDPDIVHHVEHHTAPPQERWSWRSSALDLSSLDALLSSLRAPPPDPCLIHDRDGEDERALNDLAQDASVRRLAVGGDAVALLWEVARIPDFRGALLGRHAALLRDVYQHLREDGELPEDWVAGRVKRLDRDDGDLDTLMARLAYVRTWAYLSHKSAWLADANHWQGVTRELEERLSDALHERLVQRFVDERARIFDLAVGEDASGWVGEGGEVTVGGHQVGVLTGLSLRVDRGAMGDSPALKRGLRRVVRQTLLARATAVAACSDDALSLDEHGRVCFEGEPLASLEGRGDPLSPLVAVRAHELLEAAPKEAVRRRLERWLRGRVDHFFAPLADTAGLSSPVRALLFAVLQGWGAVSQRKVRKELGRLAPAERKELGTRGLRLGLHSVFLDRLVVGEGACLKAALAQADGHALPPLGMVDAAAVPAGPSIGADDLLLRGYLHLGSWALRVDIAERVAGAARKQSRSGPFPVDLKWCEWAELGKPELTDALLGLGFVRAGGERLRRQPPPGGRAPRRGRRSGRG